MLKTRKTGGFLPWPSRLQLSADFFSDIVFKRNAMRRYVILLLLAVCSSGFQSVPEKKFSAQQLRDDLLQLEQALFEYHTGVDRHTSKEEIRSTFEKARASLTTDMTGWEFFRLSSKLVAKIQCGHTRLSPSQDMRSTLDKYFPLPALLKSGRIYVKLPNATITEVTAINGKSAQEIIRTLFSSFAVDGQAEDAKYDFVGHFGYSYALYVDHKPEKFNLELSSGKLEVAPGSAARQSFGPKAQGPISFKMINDVGYLRVETFGSGEYDRAGVSYSQFLEKTFSELRQKSVKKLIVDIRGNGGGADHYGAMLCSYLLPKDFGYFKRVFKKSGSKTEPVSHPCLSIQSSQPTAFQGKVCLMINGSTFSTAADVASVFKSNKRGTVIGRETGGGYDGNTSGASQTVTLSNSKLRIGIPMWYYENAVEPGDKHRGVIPDIKTELRVEELSTDAKDVELDLAVRTVSN